MTQICKTQFWFLSNLIFMLMILGTKAAAAADNAETEKPTTDPVLDINEDFTNKPIAELLEGDEFKLYKGLKWTIWESIEFQNAEKTRGK